MNTAVQAEGVAPPACWTTAEVAEMIHVHPQTLVRWRREGRGPVATRAEGGIRYLADDVRHWLVAGRDTRNVGETT